MPVSVSVYGNSASDATSYAITGAAQGGGVSNASIASLISAVNAERARRGLAATALSAPATGTQIKAADLNNIKSAIEVAAAALGTFTDRYGYATHTYYLNTSNGAVYFTPAGAPAPTFAGVTAGTSTIKASDISNLITEVNAAASVCVCNCNYCTCNCNYCTCNCNYACTCNCNYSDERLKTDIKFVGSCGGVNMYTFKYLWDKTVTYLGTMAHELIGTKFEAALSQDYRGFYMVNYDLLPFQMQKVA